jgi:curved DNA-binding protein CbpA
MSTKDYYRILNVKAKASASEIKHSYRRLAMKYHPDRNYGDALAAAVFSEVAEAYKVLSNYETRRQYNYQRYYTAAQEYARPAESLDNLLFKSRQLQKKIAASDPFRFNRDALLYSIKQLLPDDVEILIKTDEGLLKQFLETITICCARLTSVQTRTVMDLFQPLYEQHHWLLERFENLISRQRKKENWEKYKVVLAIIIALALCALIFFTTRS